MDDATELPDGQHAWPPPVVGATVTDASVQPWSKNAPRPDVVDRPIDPTHAPSWAPPTHQSAAPVAPTVAKRRRRWPWAVGIATVVAALLVGAIAVAGRKKSTPTATPASEDSAAGELKWDPRIVDLATFVEQSRGLKFKRAVELRLLDDDDWRASTSRGGTTMDFDIAEALGLFPQGFDARLAANVAQGSAYSAFTNGGATVNVHGTTLDPFTRAQVVHGLTHALDTQHSDALTPRVSRGSTREARIDYMIFEGNASLVENAWIATLPVGDQVMVLNSLVDNAAGRNVNAAPELLVEWMLPDRLGDEFVHAVGQVGPLERDRLFSNPPQHDAAAFDPSRYAEAAPATINELISGEPGDGPGADAANPRESAGAWLWFLTLASVEQPSLVRAAMSAYQNDVTLVSSVEGGFCVDALVVPRPIGAEALADAFEKWAEADPGHRTMSRRSTGSLRVHSCSTDRPVNPAALGLHLSELEIRNSLAASIMHVHLAPSLRSAVCLAEQAVVKRGLFTVRNAIEPPDQGRIASLLEGLDSCHA
jgi:hypothetical protein